MRENEVCMVGVKVTLGNRGMMVEVAQGHPRSESAGTYVTI